jgi:1-acyl-sn-glycerol-3-phosphate acyltransferase
MASKYSKKNLNTYNFLRKIPHYITIFFFLYPFYKLKYKIKIEGRENIPEGENLIIAANHLSYYDPTIISLSVLKPVAYMAKEELFEVPILKQFILMYGAFSVDRKKLEISTIKTAKGIAERGWHLSMFPEGTRGTEGKIGKVQNGMGYLARMTKKRILPLGIVGSSTKRGPITVKIGKPIDCSNDAEEMKFKWLQTMEELTGFESIDLTEKKLQQKPENQDLSLQEA